MISSSQSPIEVHHRPTAATPRIDFVTEIATDVAIERARNGRADFSSVIRDCVPSSERLNPHVAKLSSEDAACIDQIQNALTGSPYPLNNVLCRLENSTVVLSGFVKRYYHVQVSLKIAGRFRGQRQIVSRIQVNPSQLRHPC